MPAPTSAQSKVPLPERIGPYRILEVLGEGGMGLVYRAEDVSTGQQVALKTVREPRSSELRGIRSEILTLSRLRHPMVVRLLGHGMHGGIPWYAMELLEGRTLAAHGAELWTLENNVTADEATSTMEAVANFGETGSESAPEARVLGPLPPAAGGKLPEVLRLFRLVCEPLAYLHGLGLVHRDLKPSNVFLRGDGTLTLMDFGTIARFLGSSGREALEVGGLVVGSAAYMAPEQIRGEVGDARADLYAFGCMLYELIAGQRPFMGDTVVRMFQLHLNSEPVPLSQRVDGVPPELNALVLNLMAKQPRQRIGYVDDVAAVLESLGAPRPPRVGGPYHSYLYSPGMAGRDELFKRLVERTERTRKGEGGLVLLGGESGVGKTFLVSRVGQEVARVHMRMVAGECVPIAATQGSAEGASEVKGAPLHLFRTLLQAIADLGRQQGLEWTETVVGRRGKVLAAYEPSLQGLPGQEAHPEPPELDAEAAHRRLLEDLTATVMAFVKREGPLLLMLDDLQWADELSLDFLEALGSGGLAHAPLLVLGTYRADELGERLRELLKKPGVTQETVARLDEQAVSALVSDMLALPQPPADFVRFLARQSEGNPFFVAEYLRTAVAEGVLVREAGRWRFADQDMASLRYEALPLPDSVRELVVRRLSGLEPGARALVEMASVLGREGQGSLLRLAAEVSEDEALALIKELSARQIFEPAGEDGYRFVHDKLREHAYQSIAPERRKALHRAAALTLERVSSGSVDLLRQYGTLAHHFQQAEVWDKAVDYTEKASQQALARFSSRDAITHLERALELAARLPQDVGAVRKAAWERSLVDAHLSLGHFDEGRAHAERALRHCGLSWPTSDAGWQRGLMGQILRCTVPVPKALSAPRTPEQRALVHEAAYVYNRMLEPMFILNRPVQGLYCGVRSLNLADGLEPSAALARSLSFLPMVMGAVPPLKKVATRWSFRSLEIAEALGQDITLIYCLARSAAFHISHADWPEVEKRLGRALAIAERLGDARQLEETLTNFQNAFSAQGYFAKALEAGRRGLESGKQRGDKQILNWLRPNFGMSLSRLGQAREGVEELEAGLRGMEGSAGDADLMWSYGTLALAHLEAQEYAKAKQRADAALALVRKQRPMQYFMVSALVGMAEAYLGLWQSGQEGGAALAPVAAEACAALTQLAKMVPYGQPAALNRAGEHAWLAGQPARAIQSWRAGLAEAEKRDMPYEQGRAHAKLGQHLPQAERRNHLEQAAALFERLSAKPDLERVRRLLAG